MQLCMACMTGSCCSPVQVHRLTISTGNDSIMQAWYNASKLNSWILHVHFFFCHCVKYPTCLLFITAKKTVTPRYIYNHATEKENIETTKTEKLYRVQSFNRIQQTAPCFSLAVYVWENNKDCYTDVSWGCLVWDIQYKKKRDGNTSWVM